MDTEGQAPQHRALITLGSNVERERNFPEALERLRRHPDLQVIATSPWYDTAPLTADGTPAADGDEEGQPPFYNAAVAVVTGLELVALRRLLRAIEAEMGRERTADKFAPRPIDLDIAFFDDRVADIEGSHIPDPDIVTSHHLALPLADIAPDFVHPELGETLEQLAARLPSPGANIRRL